LQNCLNPKPKTHLLFSFCVLVLLFALLVAMLNFASTT
jgi:hypothetical protein